MLDEMHLCKVIDVRGKREERNREGLEGQDGSRDYAMRREKNGALKLDSFQDWLG